MIEHLNNNIPTKKDHSTRKGVLFGGGAVLAAALAFNALGGIGKPASADNQYSSPSATELATPNSSEAAGSPGPEASTAPDKYTILHHDAVEKSTIVFLPKNTVIVGDPMFVGGQLRNGSSLEAYGKQSYDAINEASYLQNGKIVVDTDAFTGTVVVLEEDAYVQTAPEYGFSYQTVENMEQAENLAKVKQIETKYLGCDGGCPEGVDIIHFPSDPRQGEGVDNGNPMESPTVFYPSASGEPKYDLGNMTLQQEADMILGWFDSGKIDPNSEEGILLTKYLLCICQCGPKESPIPTPSETPKDCPSDIEHAYKGWTIARAPVEKYDGQAYFQADGSVYVNGKKITKYGEGKVAVIFVVNDKVDGTAAKYRYDFGGDMQPRCPTVSDEQWNSILDTDITNTFKRSNNPVSTLFLVTVNSDGSYSTKTIKKTEWLQSHPSN